MKAADVLDLDIVPDTADPQLRNQGLGIRFASLVLALELSEAVGDVLRLVIVVFTKLSFPFWEVGGLKGGEELEVGIVAKDTEAPKLPLGIDAEATVLRMFCKREVRPMVIIAVQHLEELRLPITRSNGGPELAVNLDTLPYRQRSLDGL